MREKAVFEFAFWKKRCKMTVSYKAMKANKTLLQTLGTIFTQEAAEKEEKPTEA